MILHSSNMVTTDTVDKLIAYLCPKFGTKAADIPIFDGDRHAWLVNQYLSPSGNRTLTYVAVCDNIAVEFVTGHHYCMEYINSLRILVPDGFSFKVAQAYKWEQKTHFSNAELHDKTKEVLATYIRQNASDAVFSESELNNAVTKMVDDLFGMKPDYVAGNGRAVLEAYCRDSKLCHDFIDAQNYLD